MKHEDINIFPEDKSRPADRRPGTWKRLSLAEGGISASITCPKCGVYGTLESHKIHKDGSVWPSVVCPNDCGFHGMNVILDGWQS
jgi:predicted RNA-binding Zn-ribbon protein involved in translation (DUF1610 family)